MLLKLEALSLFSWEPVGGVAVSTGDEEELERTVGAHVQNSDFLV